MIKILQKLPNIAKIIAVDYHVADTDSTKETYQATASLKIKYNQRFTEDTSALNTIPSPRGLNDSTEGIVFCSDLHTTPNTTYERKL